MGINNTTLPYKTNITIEYPQTLSNHTIQNPQS